MRLLQPLPAKYLTLLHRWMVQQNFPAVPVTLREALPNLLESQIYGVFDQVMAEPLAALILGRDDSTSACVDVICAPTMRGRWLTRGLIRQSQQLLFEQLQLHYVWCQPLRAESIQLAEKLGFQPVGGEGYWVLLKQQASRDHLGSCCRVL